MTAIRLASCVCVAVATLGTAQTPPPRAGHVMTSAGPGGGVFLLGGQIIDDTPRVIDTLWLWNGASWRAISDEGPRNRTLPGAAFDSRRGVLVVYGGMGIGSGTRYGDTWEWTGTRWEERAIRTPGARDHHAMAYDESRGKVVLYGGESRVGRSDTFPNDTWTYDGRTWQLVDSTTGPGGLVHHAMAYDARRQRVVLFGGFGPSDRRSGDVWEWDGAKWHRVAVTGESPGARSHHRMAFDATRGETVLYGGDETGETWTWDGARWTRHAVPGPPARNVHAMAYDTRRRRVVLFGGSNKNGVPPFGYLNDVWEWDGVRWFVGNRERTNREPGTGVATQMSSPRFVLGAVAGSLRNVTVGRLRRVTSLRTRAETRSRGERGGTSRSDSPSWLGGSCRRLPALHRAEAAVRAPRHGD